MDNWVIFQTYNYLINKEESGNPASPAEFELMLNHGSLTLFKRRLGMPEEYQLQTAYTTQGYSKTSRIMVDLSDFLVIENIALISGVADIPTGFQYPIGMEQRTKENNCANAEIEIENIEIIDAGELVIRKQSNLIPISKYPICYFKAGEINILPSYISYADFTYIKKPDDAVFATTTDSNGDLEYDSGNSTELEWNDTAKLDIITILLGSAGLNLRSQEILQVSNQYKAKGI